MSEHIMEAELGCGKALSSFSKMAGQGEGIYASPTSVDVGIQQTDQNGLTLSPKSKSGDKLSLDACMITDQDFEEALKKLEPLLVETEKRILSFRVDPIYRARRCVAAPAKRRKLSGDQDEPSFHRLCSSPVIWPGSPTLHTVSTEPVRVCPKNQCYDDGNENPCSEPSVLPVSSTGDRSEEIAACQKNMGNVHLSTNKKIESVKETIPESIAFKSSHHTPNIGREISTAGSDCTVSGKDLKSQGGGVQNVHDLEMSNYGIYHEKSAGVTNPHQGKVFWDPDVPLQSIEKEHQGIGISHHTGMRSSRSRSFDEAVVYGVSVGFPCAFSQTFAGVTKVATNETTRIFEPSQDSLQSSQKSLQTSTLASIARLLLQNSQQALVEDYSKSLSSHQIPAELRQRFRALLRKFQSDEQFQKAVATYTMELTGAVPPTESDSDPIPLKIRQGFDALYKKVRTDERFKMSVEKFATDYIRDMKINGDVLSGRMEPDDDKLGAGFKRKDLNGLSIDQLTKYCRELEESRTYHVIQTRAARDSARKLEVLAKDKHRPLHHPQERNPNPGNWTCYHPQKTRKDNKEEHCGRSNPYYERRVIWKEITHCKSCKGPYNEDFKLQKLNTPRKKYANAKSKSGQAATPEVRQSPANSQANEPANAQASDFRTSPITQQDSLFGARSGQMYEYLAEDDQDYTRHLSPGWRSDIDERLHSPVFPRYNSTPMGGPFSSINGSTTDYYPMHSSDFQNSEIGNTDSLNLNMEFTGPGGEFEEFAINSDPLFMDTGIDPNPQQAGSFLEQTEIFQEGLSQFPQNSTQLAGHYPAQMNLFPQQTGSHSQSQTSPSSPQPVSEFANLSSQEAMSGIMRTSLYSTGFGTASRSNRHHEHSRSLTSTERGPLHGIYQSPYGPISPSALPQSANTGVAGLVGTLLSFPQSGGAVLVNSTAAAWGSEATNSAGLRTSPQARVIRQTNLPNAQTSLPTSQPNQFMTQTGPAIVVIDTDCDDLAPVYQNKTSTPSHSWSSRSGRRPSTTLKLPKVKTGPGLGWRAASTADSPNTNKRRAPSKAPRLSRAKATVAERAALKDAVPKTPEPEKPLTESQISKIQARNSTSAMFLGGTRKSWQEPIEQYPPKVTIEIPDDEAEAAGGDEAIDEEASQVPRGAVADQDASDALDEAFLAEFSAEFERQDRVAALGVLDERSDADGEEEEEEDENDDVMGGDGESRHNDRVIAVVAAAAAAESEESEAE